MKPLRCPFCGGPALLERQITDPCVCEWTAKCKNDCDAVVMVFGDSRADAIMRWNKRAAPLPRTSIVRSKGGSAERVVQIKNLVVPDAFRLSCELKKTGETHAAAVVLELWHVAIDMWRHLQESAYGTCTVANDAAMKRMEKRIERRRRREQKGARP